MVGGVYIFVIFFLFYMRGMCLKCFLFPVKIKSASESHFCPFFPFSSRVEIFFHGHFFGFFPFFSRVEEKFSRVEFHGLPNFFFTGTILPPSGICFFGLFSPDQRMVIGCVYHFLHLFMNVSRTLQKYFHPFAYNR